MPLLVFSTAEVDAGSVDSYDTVCRRLAIKGSCAVLSVDYRLAPETTFPGAVHDAYAATLWAARNAAQLKISPAAIAVGGDSAGGNLAAVLAQMSHDSGDLRVALQVLIYPCTGYGRGVPIVCSQRRRLHADQSGHELVCFNLVPSAADRLDPRASQCCEADLSGLARALIIAAEFDPLVA